MAKKFVCTSLNPNLVCQFSSTGAEEEVIEQSVDHELAEHGYQDSPGLRQQIRDLLQDVHTTDPHT
jgi:predicted small metal-binding protein